MQMCPVCTNERVARYTGADPTAMGEYTAEAMSRDVRSLWTLPDGLMRSHICQRVIWPNPGLPSPKQKEAAAV